MTAARPARTIFIRLCLCMLALVSAASAHDSEPINTEFASPLARHTANLNFDLQHFRGNPGLSLAGLDFEYGIANRMQFSAGMPLLRVSQGNRSVTGAGNLDLAYRYLLAGSNEKPFAISINPEIELPTGNPGVADTAYTLGALVHVDAHRGDKFWLHSNLGYATPVANFETKEKNFTYAVAAMYELTERWHPVLEVFGQHDFNSSNTFVSIAPEIIYSIGEHWELKAAVPLGASSATPSVGVQFRATWKIGGPGRQ
jgi:outer membrane putative beta-barrel porin/alpha-amylase